MNILIAPDKFKECLSAAEAADTLAAAARRLLPHAAITRLPLADGGDGFAELLVTAAGGVWKETPCTGAYGESRTGRFGLVEAARVPAAALALLDLRAHGKIAILDAASVCGLAHTAPAARDPMRASSRGVGQLVAAATNAGAAAILVGLGGVATNDLGLGALEAVGLEFTHPERGYLRAATPADWGREARLGGHLWPHIPDLRLACDVAVPLLGPNGATFAFGPQKGLAPESLNELERRAGVMAKKLCEFCESPRTLMAEPGAGAAGGLAFGLACGLAARRVSGAALVAAWLDLERAIRAADLVVTGEGAFDLGSLNGKMPGLVLELARRHGKRALVIAGRVAPEAAAALPTRPPRALALAASPAEWSPAECRRLAPEAFALAFADGLARLG